MLIHPLIPSMDTNNFKVTSSRYKIHTAEEFPELRNDLILQAARGEWSVGIHTHALTQTQARRQPEPQHG